MPQSAICRGTATTIATVDGVTSVTYHATTVVKWDKWGIVLDSGGWRTATTKTRMNQAANQFGLEFRVYQEKGEWYVDTPHDSGMQFSDGMVIRR